MNACSLFHDTVLTPEQQLLFQDTDTIRRLLATARTIAIVGLSTDPQRASSFVAAYLLRFGYRILPVHPTATSILGQPAYPSLAALPEPADIVDIFRPAHEMPSIVAQAIAAGHRSVWMQLKLADPAAAQTALDAGLEVVADKCIKMEHARHHGTLAWGGMNTGIISARKARAPF